MSSCTGSEMGETAISGSEMEEFSLPGSEVEDDAISGSDVEETGISDSEVEDAAVTTSSEPTIIKFDDDALWEILECPQCKNTMFEPIFFCKKGHSFCNDCCDYLKLCNICCADITTQRNEYAENLSYLMLDKCRFAKYGCQEKVHKKIQEEHEDMCTFETVACQAGRGNLLEAKGCGWRGKKTGLLKHVKNIHGERYIRDAQPLEAFIINKDDDIITYLLSVIGELFWLTIEVDSRRELRFEAVQYIGSIIKARNFQFKHELKYENGTTFLTFVTRTKSCFEDVGKAIASNLCFSFNSKLFPKLFIDCAISNDNSYYKLTVEKITEEKKNKKICIQQ